MEKSIQFKLNGKPTRLTLDTDRMLLWVLRTDLELTGTKYGCGESLCGACTVLVDHEAVRSCVTPLKEVEGREVITIEGLAKNGTLHPLQQAFVEEDALQCGFCTSGMLLNAYSLLHKNPHPSRAQIVGYMEDNLCRCGSYRRIIRALETASEMMKGAR